MASFSSVVCIVRNLFTTVSNASASFALLLRQRRAARVTFPTHSADPHFFRREWVDRAEQGCRSRVVALRELHVPRERDARKMGAIMVLTRKKLHNVLALSAAAVAFASFGAAVVAKPFLAHPIYMAKTQIGELQPLAGGPAIQLAKAAPGEREDCVRVTRMTGPDGKEYPTFGLVCSNP
jgi:hypothetical protein